MPFSGPTVVVIKNKKLGFKIEFYWIWFFTDELYRAENSIMLTFIQFTKLRKTYGFRMCGLLVYC